ncbi:MAG: hypothetical protein R2747_09770 [Pyrinomonadaceae bacterium]
MKTLINLVLAAFILGIMIVPARAAAGFFSYGGEEVIKVADFPDTKEFYHPQHGYIDAGYVYKQVSIFFIPIWNYEGRWVGHIGSEEKYLPMPKDLMDKLAADAGVQLPETPDLPFWEAVGGKIIFSLIILAIFGWKIFSATFDREEVTIA